MRILAVGAHPDDIELGCGATLALFRQRGHEVYLLVLTKGEASGDPELREKECEESARTIGADKVFFGNLKDTRITDGVETIMAIEKLIKELKPNIIFAHSPKDSHQDHRNVGMAALSAARNSKKVLLYESPAAMREFLPQLFVDVTSTFEVKLEALKAFGTQISKVYFKGQDLDHKAHRIPYVSNASEGLARYRGFQAGVTLAEAFEVGKFVLEIADKSVCDQCEGKVCSF
ncbi:PIG-L family deacetylase [Candidatus Bathyarchaeota archaeon]|nr:PIG-L family deacetylase [Candidatus Bathyarchaeota archaeon]